MTVLVAGGLVVLVVVIIVWSRLVAARSERRSMENYGRALGLLGDVARRTGGSASVRIVPHDVGGAHVRTETHEGEFPTAVSPTGEQEILRPGRPSFQMGVQGADGGAHSRASTAGGARSRRGPAAPAASAQRSASAGRPRTTIRVDESALRFADDTVGWPQPVPSSGDGAGAAATSSHDDVTTSVPVVGPLAGPDSSGRPDIGAGDHELATARRAAHTRSRSGDDLRRQVIHRRVGTAVATAVAIVALVLAGLQLTRGPSKAAGGRRQTTTLGSPAHHRASPPPPSTTPPTTTPKLLTPTSSTSSVVSFNAPPGSYQLTFADSAYSPSWIGVKSSASSGTWLWMWTLTPGQSESYTATGPVVVDLGAPKYVALKVNGIPAQLPNNSLPYYLSFASTQTAGPA